MIKKMHSQIFRYTVINNEPILARSQWSWDTSYWIYGTTCCFHRLAIPRRHPRFTFIRWIYTASTFCIRYRCYTRKYWYYLLKVVSLFLPSLLSVFPSVCLTLWPRSVYSRDSALMLARHTYGFVSVSVCHRSEFYRNKSSGFGFGSFFVRRPIPHCVVRKFEYLQK